MNENYIWENTKTMLYNEDREDVKTLLRKALENLKWKEDETAIEYIREAIQICEANCKPKTITDE